MVNIYELKLSLLQQRIMRLLFVKSGTSLNMNGIAKILEVSQPAVLKSIPYLQKQGFVIAKQDKDSSRWSIELNRDNRNLIWLKRADNLKQLYESGLVPSLYDLFPGSTVILFGSYSSGEDTIQSDIDLAVFGSEKKEIDSKFEELLERKIIVNYYKSFNSVDKFLLSNILNGITLKGAVELQDETV
jgi:predicted nucleotidyltransferase